jgi:hypothetical protein
MERTTVQTLPSCGLVCGREEIMVGIWFSFLEDGRIRRADWS